MTNAQIQDVTASLQYIASILEEERNSKPLTFTAEVTEIIQLAEKLGCDFTIMYKQGQFDGIIVKLKGDDHVTVLANGEVYISEWGDLRDICLDVAKKRMVPCTPENGHIKTD